ncbi:MAG: DUF6134 family protein [Acetobacterales bacterium]
MNHRIFGIFVALCLVAAQPQASAANGVTYERNLEVFRNGKLIGTRQLRISQNGDSLEVINETKIAIEVLFITAFHRTELLREVWRNNRLVEFSSRVNENGDTFEVDVVRNNNGTLQVQGAAGTYNAPGTTLPATYWHRGIVDTDTLTHVMSGELQRVETSLVKKEVLMVNGRPVATTQYRMRGDERVDIWFDDKNVAVNVMYHTDGGDKIEFRTKSSPEIPGGLNLPE